jgi:hypothetical protein
MGMRTGYLEWPFFEGITEICIEEGLLRAGGRDPVSGRSCRMEGVKRIV